MKPSADQPWREFEKLAARIYARLVPLGAEVKHDDYIPGRSSGTKRQIDVSIRYEVAGHGFLTIVQARDWATPADVNAVGEFVSVVEDVGASKGVLICRSGFTPTAHELARAKGIDLCNVHDASSQRWTLEIRVPILWIDLAPRIHSLGEASLQGGDTLPGSFEDWFISPDRGRTRLQVLETFERVWNEGKLPQDIGRTQRVREPGRELYLCVQDAAGQIAWRPFELVVEYTVSRKAWLGSFSPSECIGILHYEEGKFVGEFSAASIPRSRGADWVEVEDLDQLAVSIPGTVVSSEGWQVVEGSGRVSDMRLRHLETGREVRPEPHGEGNASDGASPMS